MKVKLHPFNNGPYIVAPSHCPYKFEETVNSNMYSVGIDSGGITSSSSFVSIVNSSLCPLCKLCEFTPDVIDKGLEIKTREFENYLTLINESVSKSISGQIFYLQKENRLPIAILISPETFDSMLKLAYREDVDQYNLAHSYFLNNEVPICYVSGCPVYLSRKLTKSSVQVVGEIEWK